MAASANLILCILILITVHQLVPQAMAELVPERALTRINSVERSGRGIIVGDSSSKLRHHGGKKPRKVMQSRGFEGRKMSQIGAGGSSSPHGGSGKAVSVNTKTN